MKSAERFIEYFGTNSSDARNDVRARYESFAAYAQVAFEGKRGAMKRPIIWYCKEDAFLKASGLQSSCAVGGVEKATAYGMLSVWRSATLNLELTIVFQRCSTTES
jgi:hypothetical protein